VEFGDTIMRNESYVCMVGGVLIALVLLFGVRAARHDSSGGIPIGDSVDVLSNPYNIEILFTSTYF
jgi:hypothetical protein